MGSPAVKVLALDAYRRGKTLGQQVVDLASRVSKLESRKIPVPKDCKTPTESELRAIIEPIVAAIEVRDGETPTSEQIQAIAEPVIDRKSVV